MSDLERLIAAVEAGTFLMDALPATHERRNPERTDPMTLTVKVGAYSSVVGGGVHIHEPDGRFAGQIMIACQTDTLRDKALQMAMCECIAKALTQFFATKGPTP